jgi:hypothetical protein
MHCGAVLRWLHLAEQKHEWRDERAHYGDHRNNVQVRKHGLLTLELHVDVPVGGLNIPMEERFESRHLSDEAGAGRS